MRYNKIRKMDISNGEGVRVSIFVQGCHFHCKGCFNPETWNFEGGKEFTSQTLTLLLDLCSNPTRKGLSILGGEPLNDENYSGVLEIVKAFRKDKRLSGKDIWVWTGYEIEDILNDKSKKEILNYLDYIICGQFIEEQKNLRLKWAGSENQRWIDVKATLSQEKGKIIEKDM